jgi:hypothetical protein
MPLRGEYWVAETNPFSACFSLRRRGLADSIINASALQHLTDILSCGSGTSPEGFSRKVRDHLDLIGAGRRELT